MSKRARLLVVLLVLVAGGVFLYPTFNWYYMVPQDQKELAAGSKEQIQSYSRGRASRDLSELKDPELISTISTGNSPYGPTIINGSDIDETITADTDPGEKWEGQLVKIENFTVD
ncbi:MAG: hypothetical protein U9N32_00560, partial [Spirochaetota bacterium]|nr:hypothetical protein [Spirochaetota bacterium]